jgi:hypothetical protein
MQLEPRDRWLITTGGTIKLRNGWCEIAAIRPVDGTALRKARKAQGISSVY